MSLIADVLKNKNKIERKEKQRRKESMENLKMESAYSAKLHEELQILDKVLSFDEEVDSVIVEVDPKHITKFMRSLYGEEMSQYQVEQLDASTFEISRKIINF